MTDSRKLGWIRLHRKFKENPIYSNSKAVHCWLECLLRANHAEGGYFLGRKKLTIKPGEFVLGRDEFGKSINMSGSTAWFWLLQFENYKMLDIKKTTKGCLCKVIKWEEFQGLDNKKTANKQQINTDKNDKNDKNVNIPFSQFWELYKKKKDKYKCELKWGKLSDKEREDIIKHVPGYTDATPDATYRKNPLTYLNGKCWEDEITKTNKIINYNEPEQSSNNI